jgi:hypothetical protein
MFNDFATPDEVELAIWKKERAFCEIMVNDSFPNRAVTKRFFQPFNPPSFISYSPHCENMPSFTTTHIKYISAPLDMIKIFP